MMPSRVMEPPAFPQGIDQGPIRIHTPPQRPTTYADPQPPASNGIRPFAYLKYRWVMVLFLGGFLASIFAFTAWSLIPSEYTTYSMVRVFSADPIVHSKEDVHGRNDFGTYIKTQASMIRSNFVLTAALRDPAVANLPMLREQPDPARFLEEKLKIEFQDGSEIIKISLSGDDPRAISMVVNSVHEAFFREVVAEELIQKKARLKQLEDAIAKMQTDVKTKFGQIKQADVDDPPSEAIPGLTANLAANQLIRLKESLAKIEVGIDSWERDKKTVEKKLGNVADEVPPPQPGYIEALDNEPRMQALARNIEKMTLQINYLIFISSDPNLPSVLELRQHVADAQEEREKHKSDRLAEYHKAALPVAEKKLKADLEQCKNSIVGLTSEKAKMEEAIEEFEQTLSDSGVTGDKLTNFAKVNLREMTKIITEMIDKANLLRLEVNAPPRVRDFQRAAVPMKKEMKKQILGTALAGLMGFGFVGLGVVLLESRVRRAMSLADVQKTVLGPILGVLPGRGDGKTISVDAISEAVEKTRAHLSQHFSQPGGKVVAVTSALTEEGKSFLAVRLAESFARSGSRTLLIDFDLRKPSLHRLLNVDNERGLCEAMTGELNFRDAIQILPNGLMFIPAGRWSADVRNGLSPERIETLAQWLRQQFDCTIVNTHPLLSVAESFLLCRNADGVLLSVERHESRLPLVARAHEKLATVATEAFGVVFQGASAEECLQ